MERLPGIELFDITDQVAVITGGSKGLGLAMAEGLASAGAHIAIVNRDLAQGHEAARRIESLYDRKAIAVSADVSDPAGMEEKMTEILHHLGRIDVLINNAGINIRGPIDELSFEQFRKVQKVNVDGIWLASKAVVPHMKKRGTGKIINVASTLGLVGLADRTPYASSKGAVVQMTRALGLELAPHGIQVNAICPGPFLTEMNIPIANSEEAQKFIVGATAIGRWGELAEIQGVAIYLASRASSYTVGAMFTVDGGWTAR